MARFFSTARCPRGTLRRADGLIYFLKSMRIINSTESAPGLLQKTAWAIGKPLRTIVVAGSGLVLAVAGFGIYRLSTAERRRREAELQSWLMTETDRLTLQLNLDPQEAAWLKRETANTASEINRATRKGYKAQGIKHDRAEIEATKAFVDLKQSIFKKLSLDTEERLLVVHKFFDEFERTSIKEPFESISRSVGMKKRVDDVPVTC